MKDSAAAAKAEAKALKSKNKAQKELDKGVCAFERFG